MALRFALVVSVFALLFFAYPAWRLADWFGLSGVWQASIAIAAFSSQFIVRFGLRHVTGNWVFPIRSGIDLLLGAAPVLVGLILCGEIAVVFGVDPAFVAQVVAVVTLLVVIWGIAIAWRPKVVEVALSSGKVTRTHRFVQISDVHIGSRSGRFLNSVIAQVNELKPDFLCITGDLVDQRGVDEALKGLADFEGPIFFCCGNHEFYEDFEEILARLDRLGVEILRGRSISHDELQIVGIDDHANPKVLGEGLSQLAPLSEGYTILLFHRPMGLEHANAHGVDLQLSGHTHNGQIKPFNWAVKTQFKYLTGLYEVGSTQLYVNEGTGTWGPTMRLGTKSEITAFTLTPAVAESG